MSPYQHPYQPQAKQLTEQEWTERVEEAQDVHQRALDDIAGAYVSAWQLAHAFYDLYEQRAYITLGYETLNEYLASPGIGYSLKTFRDYKAVWAGVRRQPRRGPADPQRYRAPETGASRRSGPQGPGRR